ncbi:MAG: glycosyltransferase family 39 protein [Acidobacteria bacterium]|nr:glycosyltransferase family 39 protein [Acidobacteriota bacterium]
MRAASLLTLLGLFILQGVLFIPLLGIQNDEALFGSVLFGSPSLMLMSYLGTLKSWIYALLLPFPISAFWIRFPMLVAGAVTIWLFFLLIERLFDTRAALAGAALLATDPLYVVTTVFDWGPTALQILLVTASLLALARRRPYLAFFLLGLAAWNKALVAWSLIGLAVGELAVFPREALKALKLRPAAAAALAFGLGALPLGIYNLRQGFATREGARLDASDLRGKALLLRGTLEGSALFEWLAHEDREPNPLPARSAAGTASYRLRQIAGDPRSNLTVYAVLLAVALLPWIEPRARRLCLFAVVSAAAAWLAMALTRGAGGSVHHAILLWPAPHFVAAAGLASASRRIGKTGAPALAAVVAILAPANLLVTNRYFALATRNGGTSAWTDAIFPLSRTLERIPAKQVFIVDWGIFDSLYLLHRGKLPLRVGSDPVSKPSLDAADERAVLSWLAEPGSVFVGHTEGNEMFPGVHRKLDAIAAQAGYTKDVLATIADRNGRPRFAVYRFSAPRTHRRPVPAPWGRLSGARSG